MWVLYACTVQLCVQENYRNNPFHNFRHCFCVTQMMYGLVHLCQLWSKLTLEDIGIMLTACICHDLDHPGYNNAYVWRHTVASARTIVMSNKSRCLHTLLWPTQRNNKVSNSLRNRGHNYLLRQILSGICSKTVSLICVYYLIFSGLCVFRLVSLPLYYQLSLSAIVSVNEHLRL